MLRFVRLPHRHAGGPRVTCVGWTHAASVLVMACLVCLGACERRSTPGGVVDPSAQQETPDEEAPSRLEREPNDSMDLAEAVEPGVWVRGALPPGDRDVFRLESGSEAYLVQVEVQGEVALSVEDAGGVFTRWELGSGTHRIGPISAPRTRFVTLVGAGATYRIRAEHAAHGPGAACPYDMGPPGQLAQPRSGPFLWEACQAAGRSAAALALPAAWWGEHEAVALAVRPQGEFAWVLEWVTEGGEVLWSVARPPGQALLVEPLRRPGVPDDTVLRLSAEGGHGVWTLRMEPGPLPNPTDHIAVVEPNDDRHRATAAFQVAPLRGMMWHQQDRDWIRIAWPEPQLVTWEALVEGPGALRLSLARPTQVDALWSVTVTESSPFRLACPAWFGGAEGAYLLVEAVEVGGDPLSYLLRPEPVSREAMSPAYRRYPDALAALAEPEAQLSDGLGAEPSSEGLWRGDAPSGEARDETRAPAPPLLRADGTYVFFLGDDQDEAWWPLRIGADSDPLGHAEGDRRVEVRLRPRQGVQLVWTLLDDEGATVARRESGLPGSTLEASVWLPPGAYAVGVSGTRDALGCGSLVTMTLEEGAQDAPALPGGSPSSMEENADDVPEGDGRPSFFD